MPPRPSKRARAALRAEQGWDHSVIPPCVPNSSPSPLDMFMSGEDDTIPQPGMFDNGLRFTPPDNQQFENGPLFGAFGEVFSEALNQDYPVAQVIPSFAGDGEILSHELFSAVNAAAYFQLESQRDSENSWLTSSLPEEVLLPDPLASCIEGLGGFSDPDNVKWELLDPASTALAYARASNLHKRGHRLEQVNQRFWLPTSPTDKRFVTHISFALSKYLETQGFHVSVADLRGKLFSGGNLDSSFPFSPHLLPGDKNLVEFLLSVLPDVQDFYLRFSRGMGSRVLEILRLPWDDPTPEDFFLPPNITPVMCETLRRWQKVGPVYQDGLGVTYRPVTFTAEGSVYQLCYWEGRHRDTVVASPFPLKDEHLRLWAAFRPTLVFRGAPARHKYHIHVGGAFFTQRILRGGTFL